MPLPPTDSQAALVCSGPQSDPKTFETKDGPITLWRMSDGGQHWQRVGIPATTGIYCTAQVAEGAPQRLLLVVNGAGGCQASHPLLSTDRGQHWRVPSPPLPPLPAKMHSCWLNTTVVPHHLYTSLSTSVLVSTTTTHTSTRSDGGISTQQSTVVTTLSITGNMRSDDDGRT
jgi:hypothetical protein